MRAPSTRTCFSSRCQPRGRTSSTACSSNGRSRYCLPPPSKARVPRTASRRARWPAKRLSQVGAVESSKSAMKQLAPELSALITIFGSTGPVISTRRSRRASGRGATRQSRSRRARVSSRKSGASPASKRAWRLTRAASSSRRRWSKFRCRLVRNAQAAGSSRSVVSSRRRTRPEVGLSSGETGTSLSTADMGDSLAVTVLTPSFAPDYLTKHFLQCLSSAFLIRGPTMTRKPATTPRLAYKGDRLKPLRAFCQTARLGSVSRAAEALFVSQPAVTQQLQSLERELGVPLLERSGRRMVPTREGEVLYELAVPLVEGLDALPDAFRQQVRGLDAGELHIAANSTTTLYLLPRLIAAFRQAQPDVHLVLHSASTADGAQLVRSNTVDLCFGSMVDVPARSEEH